MDYSFLVVTYNSEDTITDNLESIRYHIEKYSKNYKIQLVLCDDASQDKTVETIEAWLHKYESIFTEVIRIYNKENVGTCKNIANGFRHVKSEKFIDLPGDDVLSANNCFEMMDLLDKYDVVKVYAIEFANGKVNTSVDHHFSNFARRYDSLAKVRFDSYVYCSFPNGTLYRRSLLTEEVLQYIEQYKLVEDRPLWYKIVDDNPNLGIYFEEKPSLLHRNEGQGVTASVSPHKKILEEDYKKIYRDISNNTKNILIKYMIWCEWLNRGFPTKYINPRTYSKKIRLRKLKKLVHDVDFEKMFSENQNYLDELFDRIDMYCSAQLGADDNASN